MAKYIILLFLSLSFIINPFTTYAYIQNPMSVSDVLTRSVGHDALYTPIIYDISGPWGFDTRVLKAVKPGPYTYKCLVLLEKRPIKHNFDGATAYMFIEGEFWATHALHFDIFNKNKIVLSSYCSYRTPSLGSHYEAVDLVQNGTHGRQGPVILEDEWPIAQAIKKLIQ